MRIFLKQGEKPDKFAEILEEALRSAKLDADEDAADGRTVVWAPAARLRQLADRERETRIAMLSASLETYLENQKAKRADASAHSSKPADPDSVANELHINGRMSVAELKRLRRDFALANHPDRVDAHQRENATRRMMVANMLIDGEIKRRRTSRWPWSR